MRIKIKEQKYATVYLKNKKLECRMQWNIKEKATIVIAVHRQVFIAPMLAVGVVLC